MNLRSEYDVPELEISQISHNSDEFNEYQNIIKETFQTSVFVKILNSIESDTSKTYVLKKDNKVIAGFFATGVTIPLLKPVYFLRLAETRKKINDILDHGI